MDRRAVIGAHGLAALLVAALLAVFDFVPGVDVYAHASQLYLIEALLRGDPAYTGIFELNPFTPYLLPYAAMGIAAAVMGPVGAVKLVLFVALTAFVASCGLLLWVRQQPLWPSLLAWPVAFGFSFALGIVPYLLACSLGVVLFATFDRLETPRDKALWVAGSLLLAASHIMALAGMLLLCGVQALARPKHIALLVPSAVLAVLWIWMTPSGLVAGTAPTRLGLVPIRAFVWFGVHVGAGDDPRAWLAGMAVYGTLLAGGRPSRDWRRWGPFAAMAVWLLLGPIKAFEVYGVAIRYGPFALAAFLGMLDFAAAAPAAGIAVGLLGSTLVMHGIGFARFDAEANAIRPVLAPLEEGRLLRHARTHPYSAVYGDRWTELHFHPPVLYELDKHGLVEPNIARSSVQVVRQRPGTVDPITPFGGAETGGVWYCVDRNHDGPDPSECEPEATCTLVASNPPWHSFACRLPAQEGS